jgi:hypothetical protein
MVASQSAPALNPAPSRTRRLVFWPIAAIEFQATRATPLRRLFDREEARLQGGGKAAGMGKTLLFGAMRWLMIALLVSVVAMLVAVAGLARHIWLQRAQLRDKPAPATNEQPAANAAIDPVEEIDPEI